MYRAHGVPFDWLRDSDDANRKQFIAQHTVAWGWLGLVQTNAYNLISHDVSLKQISKPLLEQFDWALQTSKSLLDTSSGDEEQTSPQFQIRNWIVEYLANCQDSCRLPDMYEDLLPKIYTLLCSDAALPTATKTSKLLKFNSDTCSLPRFELVGHFLHPKTRNAAAAAYNQAVAGSAIYDLDHFGPGAIPFDLIIPGQGRGTLRLTDTEVIIDTDPDDTRVALDAPITCVHDLACVLQAALGRDIVLVGKAITLVDMIAAEFLVVFHETASGYTPTTRAFNDRLRVCGINLNINPLIRLKYATWDSLQNVDETIRFTLPDHLAAAFGKRRISASEFGATWRDIVRNQEDLLSKLAAISSPKMLMDFLAAREGGQWATLRAKYISALEDLRSYRQNTTAIWAKELDHRTRRGELITHRLQLEREMGNHWRTVIQPLYAALQTAQSDRSASIEMELARELNIRSTRYTLPLQKIQSEAAIGRREARRLRIERRSLERSQEIVEARAKLKAIILEVERARMETVKTAFLTVDGLTHTDYRPTAWWFTLVDPTNKWIDAVRQTASARWEHLVTPLGLPI
jgi:hypothetical protein